jgi:hypothetical protein
LSIVYCLLSIVSYSGCVSQRSTHDAIGLKQE